MTARPPPNGANAEEAGWRSIARMARRHITRHAKCDWHIREHFVPSDSIVKAPGLVFIPWINRPLPVAANIVIGEVVVEKSVPIGNRHVDGVVIDELFNVEILLDYFPLFITF